MAQPDRIAFADDAIRPVNSRGGGVYSTRSRSESISDKRSLSEIDCEKVINGQLRIDDRDLKKKQVFSGWPLLWLAYQSTGVIYGDIGTSPLYVYSSTFTADPTYEDILGVLSLIIWSITLMVSVKYILIVLQADDEGEGGTFALYSLLSRYANIVKRDPREEMTVKMERVMSSELKATTRSSRSFIERSRAIRIILKSIGVFGVSLVMSDGVLTPAQSVLGAIQGLSVVKPDITSKTIVGTTCAILVLLFLVQPFGTTKIANVFAPVVIIWLALNFSFGIYNLVLHDATVLKAFSPFFAGNFLVRHGTEGWKALGGVLLAFTGVEALFADLGAFSTRAIQISWLAFAYPCLLLSYIGQAAYISEDRSAWTNPFYKTVPPGMFYPSLVIAILAAVVASQAMITATFQLLSQTMKLSYFPHMKVVHTSKVFYGQIYIPFANWLLMIGTIIVTVVYSNTTRLGQAYGVCVILVTFITTCMVTLVGLIIWRLHLAIVLLGFLVFGALDGVFLSSALTKIPDGAWFTLVLAMILASIFLLWRFGKEQQWRAEASDRFPLSHMLTPASDASDASTEQKLVDRSLGRSDLLDGFKLTPIFGGSPITTIKGVGIFFDKTGQPSTTPTVFINFVQKFVAAPEIVVFFHLRPLSTPTVPVEQRSTVTRCFTQTSNSSLPMPNVFRLVMRHGYTDEVVTRDLGLLVYEEICKYLEREREREIRKLAKTGRLAASQQPDKNGEKGQLQTAGSNDSSSHSESDQQAPSPSLASPRVTSALQTFQQAYSRQTVYIVGKEQMRIRREAGGWKFGYFFRAMVLTAFLWLRDNTRSKVENLNVETQKLVEVGFVKEI